MSAKLLLMSMGQNIQVNHLENLSCMACSISDWNH